MSEVGGQPDASATPAVVEGTSTPPRTPSGRPTPTSRHSRLGEWRRWTTFAVLALASWVGVALWMAPVLDPPTVSAFLLDRVLQVSAVIGGVCTPMVLLLRPAAAIRAGLVACLCQGAVCLCVLGGGLRPPRDTTVLWLTGATLAALVVTTWWLWMHRPDGTTITLPAVIVSALVGAALPLLQLWAATSFTFGAQRVSLEATISTTVQSVSDDEKTLYVSVAVTHTNPSSTRARVLLSQTSACWAPAGARPESDLVKQRESSDCETWPALRERSWVDAGAEVTSSRVIEVPADKPHLSVTTRAEYAREDRMQFVRPVPVETVERVGECTDVERFQIRDDSRFRAVAQAEKFLQYAQIDDGRYYWVVWGDDPPCPGENSSDLDGFYSTSGLLVTGETWLTAPAED